MMTEISKRPGFMEFCTILASRATEMPHLNDFVIATCADEVAKRKNPVAFVDRLLKQYNHLKKEIDDVSNRADFLEWLYRRVDKDSKIPAKEASCKAGCSACCHLHVHITQPEAAAIAPFVEEWMYGKMKKQYDIIKEHGEGMYPHHAGRDLAACVFLKDNKCSIYENRPISCRVYYVNTDPDLCDVFKYPSGMVGHMVVTNTELRRGVMQGKFTQGSMQELLLKMKGVI